MPQGKRNEKGHGGSPQGMNVCLIQVDIMSSHFSYPPFQLTLVVLIRDLAVALEPGGR